MGFPAAASTPAPDPDGRPVLDKLTYGSLLSAGLSYLMIKQQDAVGLCLFDDAVRTLIPHRSVRKHLFYLLSNLDRVTPGEKTRISTTLHDIAERVKRRGLVILISDLMDDPDEVLMGLKHFRHRGHEVIVFHILDRRELDLNYRHEVEFTDMETGRKVRVEPAFIKDSYSQRISEWTDRLSRGCRAHQIDYNLLVTDTPFEEALTAYLNKRQRLL